MAVELSDPAVLVPLRHDGDDVVLPEAELVVVLEKVSAFRSLRLKVIFQSNDPTYPN